MTGRDRPSVGPAAADAAAHTFVDALDDTVEITGADGHHLQRVRRLRAGEHVTVADGSGAWRRYEIDARRAGHARAAARAASASRSPSSCRTSSLAVALTKRARSTRSSRACTELGVARVTPIRTRRCVVRWDAAQAERAVDRLRATAREAAAQSRRARLPEIAPVADLAELASRPAR